MVEELNESFKENESITQFRQLIYELRSKQVDIDDLSSDEIERIRKIVNTISSLGLIRILPLLSQLITNYMQSGQSEPITIKEIEKNGPWKWDQLTKYLSNLEQNGLLIFNKTNTKNKTCSVNFDSHEMPLEIKRLTEYYAYSFKKKNLTKKSIASFLDLDNQIQQCKQELLKLEEEFQSQKLLPISEKELSKFIDDILEDYNQQTASETYQNPRISIIKTIMQNPLFLKGITKEKKH